MDIPPHLVANNKDLLELARVQPKDKDMILLVDGMFVVKTKRMGEQVIAGVLAIEVITFIFILIADELYHVQLRSNLISPIKV